MLEFNCISEFDIRDEMLNILKERGIMQSWLAEKLGVSRYHLNLVLHKKRKLSPKHIEKINTLFGTHFANPE